MCTIELTEQQMKIVLLVAQGLGNKQIADEIHVSQKTVKNHISRVFIKLHVQTRQEIIVYAYENKLIIPRYLQENTNNEQ